MARNLNKKEPRIFDSMAAASAAMGISLESLRHLKRSGCPAFRGSRVHESELMEWAKANKVEAVGTGAGIPLRDQKLAEEIRKLRLANDYKDHKLVMRDDVVTAMAKVLPAANVLIEQKLVNEFPVLVAMQDAAQCREQGRKLADDLREQLRAVGAEFEKL